MSEKVYDLTQLEELAGGSQEFVDTMIDTFLEHTPGQLDAMTTAYQDKNWVEMGNVAHKIKPNIDMFGINSIKEEIRAIESKGRAGQPDEALDTQVRRVEEVLKASFDQMKQR